MSGPLHAVRLFIATPAYGGLVTAHYMNSLMAARARLERLGAVVAVYTVVNESLVTRARNACVARFLAATVDGQPFTHLLFIDADIGFPEWAVERLLSFGAPVTSGIYPLKAIRWARLAELAAAGKLAGKTEAELEALACDHAVRLAVPPEVTDDFVEVHETGAGFLCLARPVLEALIARHGAEARYQNDVPGYEAPGQGYELTRPLVFHALFEAGVDPESRLYLSEDYAFCRRWRALGGKIWADLRTRLVHVGTHSFRGDVAVWLESIGAIERA